MNKRFPDLYAADSAKSPDFLELAVRDIACADPRPLQEIANSASGALTHGVGGKTRIHVPAHYQPSYAYPLIVWLHGGGSDEREVCDVLPQISDRNLFGVGLRGPRLVARGSVSWEWPTTTSRIVQWSEHVARVVREMRRVFHIHSERVFLAGRGQGATTALHLLLTRPEWFAGAALLGGSMPRMNCPLAGFRRLQSKRVLMQSDPQGEPAPGPAVGRLLHAAGMDVTMPAGTSGDSETWSRINGWLMTGLGSSTVIA